MGSFWAGEWHNQLRLPAAAGRWIRSEKVCPFPGPSPAPKQHTLQPGALLCSLVQSFCLGQAEDSGSVNFILGNRVDVSWPVFLLGAKEGLTSTPGHCWWKWKLIVFLESNLAKSTKNLKNSPTYDLEISQGRYHREISQSVCKALMYEGFYPSVKN